MTEAIQTINLSDYTQTGEGGTAITYTKKDEQSLAKLYKNGFEADRPPSDSCPTTPPKCHTSSTWCSANPCPMSPCRIS